MLKKLYALHFNDKKDKYKSAIYFTYSIKDANDFRKKLDKDRIYSWLEIRNG